MLSATLSSAQNSTPTIPDPYAIFHPSDFNYLNKRNANWVKTGDGTYTAGPHTNSYAIRGPQEGFPAAYLPGGPGSTITSNYKEYFHPKKTRVILSDWRGVGTSSPNGPMSGNHTTGLIDDIGTMQQKLGSEKMLLLGASWGAGMAIAYSKLNPDKVSGLILRLPLLATHADKQWNYGPCGIAKIYPHAYQAFCKASGKKEMDEVLESYLARLKSDDPYEQKAAFVDWSAWEVARSGHTLDQTPDDIDASSEEFQQGLNRIRVMADYTLNNFYLNSDGVLGLGGDLPDIPTIVVANEHDPMQRRDYLPLLYEAMPAKTEFLINKGADWHSIFKPHSELGITDSFVKNGCAYGAEKIRRLYCGN